MVLIGLLKKRAVIGDSHLIREVWPLVFLELLVQGVPRSANALADGLARCGTLWSSCIFGLCINCSSFVMSWSTDADIRAKLGPCMALVGSTYEGIQEGTWEIQRTILWRF